MSVRHRAVRLPRRNRPPRALRTSTALPGRPYGPSPPLRHMAFRSPSTPSARRNARPVACTKLWVMRGALGRLVMMGALVGLGTPLECCSEGDSFWSDLDDPRRARHPAPVRTLPPNCLACPGAGDAWCLTCAPLPRFPEQAHASCRPWGPHLPLRQPLPSAAGRCESQPAPLQVG